MPKNKMLLFRPDDVLVVTTDGLNEAYNQYGEMFGYERLLLLVEKLASRPAAEIAHGLIERIKQFTGNLVQHDDQTIVVVKGIAA